MDFLLHYNLYRNGNVGAYRSVSRSRKFLAELVPDLDDKSFKIMFRLTREHFFLLLHLIEEDLKTAIKSKTQRGRFQTLTPMQQLQVVLYRLGHSVTNSQMTALFGICQKTIEKYSVSVFSAIIKLKPKFLFWPSAQERSLLVGKSFKEMPHCLGSIDGTEVKLRHPPRNYPEAYLSRKLNYCVKVTYLG